MFKKDEKKLKINVATLVESCQSVGMNKTELKIKKIENASQAHGRGSDNHRCPARWGIYVNDELAGTIIGKKTRQFELPEWTVYAIKGSTAVTYLPVRSMRRPRSRGER